MRPNRPSHGGVNFTASAGGSFAAPVLARVVPPAPAVWLLVDGVLHSVGAILYWLQWPRGWPGRLGFHALRHVCVLAASASHFWAIHAYVLPLPCGRGSERPIGTC